MSLKVYDGQDRWRNKTVAFRISPVEDEQLESAVRLSGLTKQDYIIQRLLCLDVVVQGIPFEITRDVPNAETVAAIKEVQAMKENPSLGKSYTDVDAMLKELLD